MSALKQQFEVGDHVQSAPGVDDWYGSTWVAEIISVMTGVDGAPDGCAYETLGRWSDEPSATRTLRQLWSKHLVKAEVTA